MSLVTKLLVAGVAASLSLGCHATFREGELPKGAEQKTAFSHHYLFGLVGGSHVDIRDLCGSQATLEVRSGANLLTVGASVLTLGIYTPRRVRVSCAARTETP